MIDWLRDDFQNPTVEIDGQVIPIALRRHGGAKRLVMRLAPDGSELRITMPRWGRTREALDFAEGRKDWLRRQLSVLPQFAPPTSGDLLPYRGALHQIKWREDAPRAVRLTQVDWADGAILGEDGPDRAGLALAGLDGAGNAGAGSQVGMIVLGGPRDTIANRLERWLRAQARPLMEADLAYYCGLIERPVPPLALSSARQRWGSCSSSGTVRINWRLIMAPDFVRRSVVAHEVAHLVHFDHSPAFHQLLREMFGDELPAADAWIKKDGRGLYRQFS